MSDVRAQKGCGQEFSNRDRAKRRRKSVGMTNELPGVIPTAGW